MSDQKPEKPVEDPAKGLDEVVSKPPVVRRRTMFDIIVDRASTASVDLINNIIVPGVLGVASDAMHGMIDSIIVTNGPRNRGASRNAISATPTRKSTRVDYNGVSSGRAESRKRTISEMARANHDFDEIIFQNRVEAQDVIEKIRLRIDKYSIATVDDLYSAMGIDPTFADTSWGWDSFDGAHVRHIRNGFILALPEPTPLN